MQNSQLPVGAEKLDWITLPEELFHVPNKKLPAFKLFEFLRQNLP